MAEALDHPHGKAIALLAVALFRRKKGEPEPLPGGHPPQLARGCLLHSEALPKEALLEDAIAAGIARFGALLATDPPSPLLNFKATKSVLWTLNPDGTLYCADSGGFRTAVLVDSVQRFRSFRTALRRSPAVRV